MSKRLEQTILIGRSIFATLVTEFNISNAITRLVVKNDEGYVLAWAKCNGEEEYKSAVLRLSKKLKRRISYVYIIPVVEEVNGIANVFKVKRTRLEIS